jgi:uncharacterized protein YndB with AHSA1/START domain
MSEQDRVLVDMTIGAPVDAVWAALRDPERIRQWFGWDAPGLEAEIRHFFHESADADDEARTLTWSDGDRVVVESTGDTTQLKVVRRTVVDGTEVAAYDPVDEGWITFTQQLRFLVERHRDEKRRTLTEGSIDLGTEDDALLARLGLRELGDQEVGSRYTVTRPDGSTFTGDVYFQTDLQVGLAVDEEGGALLVVARTPPAAAPPHGTARFLLNLYSTDEARLAEASARWRRWWNG